MIRRNVTITVHGNAGELSLYASGLMASGLSSPLLSRQRAFAGSRWKSFGVECSDWIEAHGAQVDYFAGWWLVKKSSKLWGALGPRHTLWTSSAAAASDALRGKRSFSYAMSAASTSPGLAVMAFQVQRRRTLRDWPLRQTGSSSVLRRQAGSPRVRGPMGARPGAYGGREPQGQLHRR